ncbi:MAG: hypothetical protein V4485_06030 [Pseudomonadota bacterium]
MSLQFIYYFQSTLYSLLTSNNNLPKIYLSVQQDAKYPFILINLQKAVNLSKPHLPTYEIDFEICIFARDKAQETILKTMSVIGDMIRQENLSNNQYKVLSVKDQNLEWVRGHDLLTTKLVVSYKSLIQSI